MTGPIGPILPVSPPLGTAPPRAADAAAQPGGSFSDLLGNLLGQVRTTQAQAQQAEVQVVSGQSPDLARVVLTSEAATLSLELAAQVRNKVLEAYQDLMRMPL